jgi:hypothetical protein
MANFFSACTSIAPASCSGNTNHHVQKTNGSTRICNWWERIQAGLPHFRTLCQVFESQLLSVWIRYNITITAFWTWGHWCNFFLSTFQECHLLLLLEKNVLLFNLFNATRGNDQHTSLLEGQEVVFVPSESSTFCPSLIWRIKRILKTAFERHYIHLKEKCYNNDIEFTLPKTESGYRPPRAGYSTGWTYLTAFQHSIESYENFPQPIVPQLEIDSLREGSSLRLWTCDLQFTW